MTLNDLAQIDITIFGCGAIYLVSRKDDWKRWGYICGILSQPGWFYHAYQTGGWGIFLLCTWYAFAWVQGIYNYWIKVEN